MNQEQLTDDQCRQVLRMAKEFLATDGWRQGDALPVVGEPGCLLNSLAKARKTLGYDHLTNFLESDLLRNYVVAALGLRTSYSIMEWNDAPSRTIDDVFAALDAALVLLDNERECRPLRYAVEVSDVADQPELEEALA